MANGEGKGPEGEFGSGDFQEEEDDVKTTVVRRSRDQLRRYLAYGRSGIWHTGGLSLEEVVVRKVGNWVTMLTENPQVAGITKATVRMRHPGAD